MRGTRVIDIAAPTRRKARLTGLIGSPIACYLCGEPLDHESAVLEHVTPRCRGGLDYSENVRWACVRCNRIKSTHTVEELLVFARALLRRYPLG